MVYLDTAQGPESKNATTKLAGEEPGLSYRPQVSGILVENLITAGIAGLVIFIYGFLWLPT